MLITVPEVMLQGFSPYFLMYGRQPLLPVDIEFGVFTPDVTGVATQKYVQM